MAYRIEYAASGRAGCKGPKACKESGDANKIPKGALRMGTVVEIQGNTTFMWRHWGCVTDTQCAHLKEKLEEPENLDGYEDLNPEDQQRVNYIFENGKLPDEDVTPVIREDIELKASQKAEKAAAKEQAKADKAAARKSTKASGSRKRKSAAADDEEDDDEAEEAEDQKPPAKKRGRPPKAKQEVDSPNKRTSGRPRKSYREESEEDDDEQEIEEKPEPPQKRGRGRPRKVKPEEKDEEEEEEEKPEPPQKRGRGRPRKEVKKEETEDDSEEAAPEPPKKRGRPPKAKKEETKDEEEEEEAEAPKKRGRGRPRKSEAEASPKKRGPGRPRKSEAEGDDEQSTEAEPAPAKKRGRPPKAKPAAEEPEAGPSAQPEKATTDDNTDADAAADSGKSFDPPFVSDSPSRPKHLESHPNLPTTPPRTSARTSDPTTSPSKPFAPTESMDDHEMAPAESSEPASSSRTASSSYNAASLLSYLRESLASSPLASGYRGLNGQLRIHTLFSTPQQARDLFPLAHLDLASADAAAGRKQPVDAYLEHILVTVSYAPNTPAKTSQTAPAPSESSTSLPQSHTAQTSAADSAPGAESPTASSASHQMTLALECFLYTIPAHRAAILYISKLDSTGLGPSCPKSAHVPFLAEGIDPAAHSRASHSMAQPSTTLTRAVTTAFISYFASFQHWLPFSAFTSHNTNLDRFPYPPRLENTLEARRIAVQRSPIRHLSVHVLARAQRCYLFPDSDLNPVKRVLSDGGLIKWWRRTLSDSIFASRFEHARAENEGGGAPAKYSKLAIAPFYLIPGYSKYESHPLVPLPSTPAPANASMQHAQDLHASTSKMDLHPSWPIPFSPSPTPTFANNATSATIHQAGQGASTVVSQPSAAARTSTVLPVLGRSISPLWEELGNLDERVSVSDARWTYDHPYSASLEKSQEPPTLPLYHPTNSADAYDSEAATRGWRSISTLLPHFEDDPKSRFVDEIARDAHEHGGPSVARAVAAATAKAKSEATLRESQNKTQPSATPREPGSPVKASGVFSPSSSRLSPSKQKNLIAGTRKVSNAATEAGGSPLKAKAKMPAGMQSVAQSTEAAQAPAPTGLKRSVTLRNQIVERAALDHISADEFWERMGFRQECCSGNVVGVFVVLFTLEDPQPAPGMPSLLSQLPPATAPVAQPLSLPNPSIRDMVLKNIMRDACDWSNEASAEKLTQAWGEAVHRIVMRKGNVRKYLATGEGGSDLNAAAIAAGLSMADQRTGSGGKASAPQRPIATPTRTSMRIAGRDSASPSIRMSPSPSKSRIPASPVPHAMGTRSRTASLARVLEAAEASTPDIKKSPVPGPTLEQAPPNEPTWIGYNTIWTTVALHGPPPRVVQRADQKHKTALAEAEAQAKLAFAEMQRDRTGTAQGQDGTKPGSGGAGTTQPVTMLTVKKKRKPMAA